MAAASGGGGRGWRQQAAPPALVQRTAAKPGPHRPSVQAPAPNCCPCWASKQRTGASMANVAMAARSSQSAVCCCSLSAGAPRAAARRRRHPRMLAAEASAKNSVSIHQFHTARMMSVVQQGGGVRVGGAWAGWAAPRSACARRACGPALHGLPPARRAPALHAAAGRPASAGPAGRLRLRERVLSRQCERNMHRQARAPSGLPTCVEHKHVRPFVQQLRDADVQAPGQHQQAVGQQQVGRACQGGGGGHDARRGRGRYCPTPCACSCRGGAPSSLASLGIPPAAQRLTHEAGGDIGGLVELVDLAVAARERGGSCLAQAGRRRRRRWHCRPTTQAGHGRPPA